MFAGIGKIGAGNKNRKIIREKRNMKQHAFIIGIAFCIIMLSSCISIPGTEEANDPQSAIKKEIKKDLRTEVHEVERDGIHIKLEYIDVDARIFCNDNNDIYQLGNITFVCATLSWDEVYSICKWAVEHKGYEKSSIYTKNELMRSWENLDIGVNCCYNAFSEFLGLEPVYYTKKGEPVRTFSHDKSDVEGVKAGGFRMRNNPERIFFDYLGLENSWGVIDREPYYMGISVK